MRELAPSSLARLFEDVTDKKLLRTVALIDRLPRRGTVDELLAPLRPRLLQLKPPRPLTLRRLLTLPLEELLVPAAAWRPGSPRLSRDLLGTIQETVVRGLDPDLGRQIEACVAGHTMRDKAVIEAGGNHLWPAAAEALRAALRPNSAGGDGKGRNRRQQLEFAAELLRIAPTLTTVFLTLPEKPLRQLGEAQLERLGRLLVQLERMGGHALALGVEALGRRLGDAALLLLVLQHTGDGDVSTLRLSAAKDAGRRVAAELDETAEQLRRAGRRSATALAEDVVRLVGTLSALEAGPLDLPVDRAGLQQIARKAAKAVEGHLRDVVQGEVLDGFKSLGSPATNEATILAVEAAARAARKLGAAGRQLGLDGQIDRVVKGAFDAYRGALTEPGSTDDACIMDQLRIVEIIFGADAAADLLTTHHRARRPQDA